MANSTWAADPDTLRLTALALCYSTGEYCSAVWARSSHAHRVDPVLNKACHTITGTLRATPLSSLYRLTGIAPPDIRRETTSQIEREKQTTDSRHPLYGHQEVKKRLTSRRSFMTVPGLGRLTAEQSRLSKWRKKDQNNNNGALPEISESLPAGKDLPRKDWVTLNRARSKVAKTGDNLAKWGIQEATLCPCGEPVQTIEHVLRNCPLSTPCTDKDLRTANKNACHWIKRWRDKI